MATTPTAAPAAPVAPAADNDPVVGYSTPTGQPIGAPDNDPVVGYTPPPAPGVGRGAFSEIGTGFARGALVDLPQMAGQALQYAGAGGVGGAVRDFGTGMAAKPWLTLNPAEHGGVVNALASGAEQIAPILAPVAGVAGAALAAPIEIPAAVIGGAGAVAGGALAAGSAGQATLEKAQAKGLSPQAAQESSRLNAATTFATQVGLGLVGGQVLGAVGGSLGRLVGQDAAPLASDVLGQLAGQGSVLGATAKAAAVGGAEAVGLGAAQAAASAGIEQHYGVDDQSPLAAAAETIPSMLGLTALLTPFGLAGRALGARAAQARTARLADANAEPAQRQQFAEQYAQQIEAKSGDKAAADAFRQNAQYAIENKQPLPVSADMFTPGQAKIPDIMAANEQGANNPLPTGQQEMFGHPSGQPQTGAEGQGELFGQPPAAPEGPLPQPGQLSLDLEPPAHDTQAELNFWNSGTELVPATPTIQVGSGGHATTPEQRAQLAQEAARGNVGPQAQTRALVPATPTVQVDSSGVATTPEQRAAGAQPLTPMERAATTPQAQQIHAQIRAALDGAGEPLATPMSRADFNKSDAAQGLTGQARARAYNDYLNSPSTLVSLMREDADTYSAMRQREAVEAQQSVVTNPLVEGTPAAERTNTQLPDALSDAQRRAQEDAAYGQRAAQTDAERAAIANQTRGADLAAAAARGEVQPDLNAPKGADEIARDIAGVNEAQGFDTRAQSMTPFGKRLDALNLESMPTHEDQIAAVEGLLSDKSVKMSDTMRDRFTALAKQWRDEQPEQPEQPQPAAAEVPEAAPAAPATNPPEAAPALTGTPPPQAEALGNNTPVTADASTEQPAQAAQLGANVEQSAQSHAQDTADMVDTALAGFNTRVRNGEQLAPLEQERMEDLQGFRNALAEITSGNNTSDSYARDISNMAREAATTPYTETFRRYVTGTPEATDPAIMFDALRTGKLQDTLNTIGQRGSTDDVKALAQRLSPLLPDTTIKYAGPSGDGAAGEYLRGQNHVNVFPGGESEATILHEAVHAATSAQIDRAANLGTPRTQAEASLKNAFNQIESIRQDVIKRTGSDEYGLTNAHEFVAELHANPEFQQFLKDAKSQGRSLWSRAVDAVKGLLGIKDRGYLEQAMDASHAFFGDNANSAGFPLPPGSEADKLFRKSPAGAAKVVDERYSKMGGLLDRIKDANYGAMNLNLYKATLPWKTVQFIADRIRALPEMVKSGFAQGLDAYQHAQEQRRIVMNAIEHPVAQYADGVRKMLNGLKDADAQRDLSKLMATIGGEASRGGFDFRLNYADNVKAGRDLPGGNKAYVDDIHRQFQQLARTNPEAAKAIENGELQNRRTLIMKAATVARNLIQAHADAAMEPHVGKLDIMAADLKSARNSDPKQFVDGATAALHQRLQQAFADAREKLPQGSMLRDQFNELSDMYNAQSQNPYFSLGRSGDYFVKVGFKDMDAQTQAKLQDALKGTNKVLGNLLGGEDHAFFRVDTLDQAQGLYNKLLQAGGDKIDGNASAKGKLADRVDSAFGVSPALRSMLASLHDTVERQNLPPEAAATMRDTITRELLSMLPETSSRSALMQRRGIPGYDADFLGNFARRAMGGVLDTSNMHTQGLFTDARTQMSDGIEKLNRTGNINDAVRAQMAADEVNRRYANSQKPIDNTTINTINSLGHTFYLAASPAYLLRTTAQPFHRALPIIGARYGFVKSAAEVARSTAVALKVMANTIADGASANGLRGILDANTSFKNLGLPANEQAFIQELHDRGVMNLGQARQLQQMAMGGTQRQQDLTRAAAMTAQYAEMTNRLAVGLAAFRLAERQKPGDAANTEWAINTIDRAMDNFDPTNTARAISKHGFAGKYTPLLTAFMNYQLQTMQQIARTVHDGLFNKDGSPEGIQRRNEARKEFGGLMATTAMISGVMGLPFANVFAGVWNTFNDLNDPNNPRDIRMDVQKFLEDHLGSTVGGVISHGVPRAWGFDSSTFGLENLLPGSEFLSSRQLLKDRLGDLQGASLGPALSAGLNIVQAADLFKDGYMVKGIEKALPSGLKPYFKAGELATNGYTDSKGNPIGLDANGWDIGLQAVGFQSAKKATQEENQQWASARQDRLDYQRGLISDQFYKGATTGDQAVVDKAAARLTDYNRANPTQPYTDIEQGIQQKLMGLALARATGTGVSMQIKQLPSLSQQLLWAQTPAIGGMQ